MEDKDKIRNGNYVVVQRGDHQRIIHFQAQQLITYGKGQTQQDIQLGNVEGHKFYTAFRILPAPEPEVPEVPPEESDMNKNNKKNNRNHQNRKKKLFTLEFVNEPASRTFSSLTFDDPLLSLPKGQDNRNILDDKASQPLGHTDINELRDQGLSSTEILTTIVSSSKSFTKKTEYSQEKYLRKKEKVHGDLLLFLPVDLFLLSEYYFRRDPSKVLGLRVDTLSQILSYSNVHSGGRCLLYENASGILVAACLERMGGQGVLLHCHAGTHPQRQAVNYMNFTEKEREPLNDLDVFYLIKGRNGGSSSSKSQDNEEGALEVQEPLTKKFKEDPEIMEVDTIITTEDVEETLEEDQGQQGQNGDKKQKSLIYKEQKERSLSLLNEPFQSLIICSREYPLSILQRLIGHLQPSGPFVVYSAFPEPLKECYMWIKDNGLGINMQVVDNWMRSIQVDTDRTHPEINMSSGGGYIMYGTYVRDPSSPVVFPYLSSSSSSSSAVTTATTSS